LTQSPLPPMATLQAETTRNGQDAALLKITSGDLSFRGKDTSYASHNTHAFAAKFPPQLPRTFIQGLTRAGDTVLDPMAGSGTALVEAALLGRSGLGVDLDPLAALITQAKSLPFQEDQAIALAEGIEDEARRILADLDDSAWLRHLECRHPSTRDFIAYWFDPRTAQELFALASSLRQVTSSSLAPFFRTVFSSLVVTKSGGVSLARDLAHSRPHKVRDKTYRDSILLFRERSKRSIVSLTALRAADGSARVVAGDARRLPIASESVHLIVTSPPYANAIDYVRAHKFSLVWLGWEIPDLGLHRRQYIGAEHRLLEATPLQSALGEATLGAITLKDKRRAGIVRRYFLDMQCALREMHRVLRPGRSAVIVVGSSTVRGTTVPTAFILSELAKVIGFRLVAFSERPIDRDRRLMPISGNSNSTGIEARMHSEHVISLVKD
jgi:DNA modification methylase